MLLLKYHCNHSRLRYCPAQLWSYPRVMTSLQSMPLLRGSYPAINQPDTRICHKSNSIIHLVELKNAQIVREHSLLDWLSFWLKETYSQGDTFMKNGGTLWLSKDCHSRTTERDTLQDVATTVWPPALRRLSAARYATSKVMESIWFYNWRTLHWT